MKLFLLGAITIVSALAVLPGEANGEPVGMPAAQSQGGKAATKRSGKKAVLSTLPEEQARRNHYKFRQPETPFTLAPVNLSAYAASPNQVTTMRGEELFFTPRRITEIQANPANTNFFLISQDKKGRIRAELASLQETQKKLRNFDTEKMGIPTSAIYTPDARQLLVATDKGIWIFHPSTLLPEKMLELDLAPTQMAMSSNGYFLAMAKGDQVTVMNYEAKTIRREWNFGTKVNDITFNPASSELAVLTADGMLTVYDTRSFNIKNDIDELGEGLSCAFNADGKYIAVATSPTAIEVVNLLRPEDRNTLPVEEGGLASLKFIKDTEGNSILVFTATNAIQARRLPGLEPSFNKLVAGEVDRLMDEWQKMMPGESMDEYKLRVNEESRSRQRRLFEDEISTQLAGNLLEGEQMSLGGFDRANQVLALEFESMPTIYLPVPEEHIGAFRSASDLLLSDVQYGLLPDDTFEIVYAKVFNKADGRTYEYNNHDRVSMAFLEGEQNVVSLEVLQMQQMEELKLQELKEKVVEEARNNNVITGHTNIAVDSKVVPDYNADGERILNYDVTFTYEVEPGFSAAEDFGPGKYQVGESGAASSMLKIVKEALEGELAEHLKKGRKVKVTISGTADATPIVRTIPYDGTYGEFTEEPIVENGEMTSVTVTKASGIRENRELAFLRAQGVRDFLQRNVPQLAETKTNYSYNVDVSEGKGSEYRRITANFIIYDVF